MKKFDLNIDQMLENWDASHAIREIIANALDEQMLTGTQDVIISRDGDGAWHIRDFGRGLRHEHFTMNENKEKLLHPGLIGKFGVGLKDSLATFDRLGIETRIRSRFCDVSFDRSEKHDFSDVITLHACISDPSDPEFAGTEFTLKGCTVEDIETAKRLFLRFSGEECLEKTPYGEVLRKAGKVSYIYINGIRVAEEENFLFSYNITSLTTAIKKALNRERTNVGRTAYSDRVKAILLASSSEAVAETLVDDLGNFGSGTLHDEMKWTDVSAHAVKITNTSGNVLFLTGDEIMNVPRFVEEARASGRQIITIPNSVKDKLSGQVDTEGNAIQDLGNFVSEWNDSFEFKFIEPDQLSQGERSVYDLTAIIADLVGGLPSKVQSVKISETMRPEEGNLTEALGLWNDTEIIIKRCQLNTIESYASTLLHEIAHARSGETDVSIGFEQELTTLLGEVASRALSSLTSGLHVIGENSCSSDVGRNSCDIGNEIYRIGTFGYRLVVDRPSGWEYLFLFWSLREGINVVKRKHGPPGPDAVVNKERVAIHSIPEAQDFAKQKIDELEEIVSPVRTIEPDIQKALGDPGQPGDPELLLRVATTIAESYRALLLWRDEVSMADCSASTKEYLRRLCDAPIPQMRAIEEFCETYYDKVDTHIKKRLSGDSTTELNIGLKLPQFDRQLLTSASYVRELPPERRFLYLTVHQPSASSEFELPPEPTKHQDQDTLNSSQDQRIEDPAPAKKRGFWAGLFGKRQKV